MEKSPFWMEIYPFIFFQKRFELYFEKNSAESFLRSEWRNLHSEWRFLHSNVFQTCFELKKKNSAESFLRSEWRNLHSEWRFLHSFFSETFFCWKTNSIQNGDISILNGDFSIQMFFSEVFWTFFEENLYIQSFFHSELRLLHSNRRFLYSFKRIIFLYSEFSILI